MAPKRTLEVTNRLSSKTTEAKAAAAKALAAEQKKKDQSALLGALKATRKEGAAELLETYKGLGRFDGEKNVILQKYINDKSLGWMNAYVEEKKFVQKETQEGAEGFTSLHGVAKLLGMSSADPALSRILEEVPSDDLWDEGNALERGFKKAGLKRYKLDYIDGLIKKTSSKEDSSAMSSEAHLKDKKALVNAPSSSSGDVKIEMASFVVLKNDSKIIAMGERKIEKTLQEFKKLRSQLIVAKKPEGSHSFFAHELFFCLNNRYLIVKLLNVSCWICFAPLRR